MFMSHNNAKLIRNGCLLRHDSIVDYGGAFSSPKDFLRRNYYRVEFKKDKKNTWRGRAYPMC